MNPVVKSGCKSKRLFCSAKNFQKFFSLFCFFRKTASETETVNIGLCFLHLVNNSTCNEQRPKAAANVEGFVARDTQISNLFSAFYLHTK
jgi:hypothetical protein